MSILSTLVDDFKAWRAGMVRIAPRGTRGRIYTPRAGAAEAGAGTHEVKQKVNFKGYARVIRADGRPDEFRNLQTGESMTAAEYAALQGEPTNG